MKPAPFQYRRPETLEEALHLLGEIGDEASVLAGGQSLVPMLNLRLARPGYVVDVNRLPGLDAIEVGDAEVRIGALARSSTVERDPRLRDAVPLVSEALAYAGHPQIRNRSTAGGNVAHADPASELPAVLACLDGSVTLASREGERTLAWDDFFQGVFTTARRPDELVVRIDLPADGGRSTAFVELARRHGDFALAGASVALRREERTVADARIALFGVAPLPVRAREAEAALEGQDLGSGGALAELAAAVRRSVDPFGDVHGSAEYRRHLAGTLAARAAAAAWERSGP